MFKKILPTLMLLLFLNPLYAKNEKGIWSQNKINKDACAIYQIPLFEKGDYTKRGQVVFFVIKDGDVMYVRADAGYPYDENKYIKVSIDGNNYQFYGSGDTAWSMSDDRVIIDAMKAGKEMKVIGFSSRGTETIDTYSLIGFTSSLNKLNESC
ncbi:invasion associated locus B family protein [Alphaproteobacteria bacterium]|nr:invasion associated locus B family protein [Alphaproteobacteria bacterium]